MPMQRLLARLVIVVVAVFGTVAAGHAAEAILSFESKVVVAPDGVLDVTETIQVRAEGIEIRRGIYRDFPLTFEDDQGGVHHVSFDIVSVMRDGRPEPYHTNANSDGVRIYMGDADTFLPSATYTYQLRYTTGRQVRFFADHTELFWNVTGNDWSFPILSATARIALLPLRKTNFL